MWGYHKREIGSFKGLWPMWPPSLRNAFNHRSLLFLFKREGFSNALTSGTEVQLGFANLPCSLWLLGARFLNY